MSLCGKTTKSGYLSQRNQRFLLYSSDSAIHLIWSHRHIPIPNTTSNWLQRLPDINPKGSIQHGSGQSILSLGCFIWCVIVWHSRQPIRRGWCLSGFLVVCRITSISTSPSHALFTTGSMDSLQSFDYKNKFALFPYYLISTKTDAVPCVIISDFINHNGLSTKLPEAWIYKIYLLKPRLDNKDFLSSLLIGGWLCCQANQELGCKSLLTNMDFNVEIP